MRRIVKGVGSGIGLAAEGIAHHKEKKAAAARSPSGRERDLAPGQNPDIGPPRDLPAGEGEESDDSDVEDDEQAWHLDEAAEGMTEKKDSSKVAERELTVDELVYDFEAHHPPPAYSETDTLGSLQCPVVLPQKRPQSKDRGFVRAYAPILGDCGIDQATFLEFLDDFDKSTQASQYITVINLAAGIVGFVPSPIIMGVSIAVQVAAGVAKAVQTRHRTNTFLDQMNDKLFRPHGLYCMLITYKPGKESSGEPVMISSMISKAITPADSKFKNQMKLLRMTSGTAKGEMEIPEAAPLIFPALDEVVAAGGEKKNGFVRSSKFASNYADKRAQAKYAYEHPDSKLAVPEQPQFASRYSDPNHPANSGSLISLVTGGHVNPMAKKQRRREWKRERRAGRPLTEEERRAPKKGIITRYLKQDILYMIIVNMPTQAEMDEAMKLAGVESGQFEQDEGSVSRVTSEVEAMDIKK